jgi:predicted nucleotidyltransferase
MKDFFTLRSGRCEKSIWQINDIFFLSINKAVYDYSLKIGCFFYHERPNRFMEILQDPLLEKLTENVKISLGNNLKKIILFGSRARGDFQTDSDYDILVLVNEYHQDIRKKLNDIGGDFFYEYSLLFPMIAITEKRFQTDIYEPFLRNIRKEGKIVWMS